MEATNAASQAVHGVMEAYEDLSSAGVIDSGTAQAAGQSVLAAYQRATYAGPFTIRQGQLLTMGGTPIDIGAERGIPQVAKVGARRRRLWRRGSRRAHLYPHWVL